MSLACSRLTSGCNTTCLPCLSSLPQFLVSLQIIHHILTLSHSTHIFTHLLTSEYSYLLNIYFIWPLTSANLRQQKSITNGNESPGTHLILLFSYILYLCFQFDLTPVITVRDVAAMQKVKLNNHPINLISMGALLSIFLFFFFSFSNVIFKGVINLTVHSLHFIVCLYIQVRTCCDPHIASAE